MTGLAAEDAGVLTVLSFLVSVAIGTEFKSRDLLLAASLIAFCKSFTSFDVVDDEDVEDDEDEAVSDGG